MRLILASALLLVAFAAAPVTAQVLPPPPFTPTPAHPPPPRAATPEPWYLADPQLDWNDPQSVTIHACNERSVAVNIAFVYPEAPKHTASGWYVVQPGGCQNFGAFPIRHYGFAYYADARDGWAESGATPYCVRPGRAFKLALANDYSRFPCPDGFDHRPFTWVTLSSFADRNATRSTYDLTFR